MPTQEKWPTAGCRVVHLCASERPPGNLAEVVLFITVAKCFARPVSHNGSQQ
jgi:hypothetical protein